LHETVDVHAEPAYILKREATRISPAQSSGGGHRRSQSGDGYGDGGGTCDAAALPSRTAAITTECCDEQSEDCSGGYPQVCNVGCAALFLPFWDECRPALGKDSRNFEPTVRLCAAVDGAAGSSRGSSLAEQLNVQCTDGTAAADCIPECDAARHGYMLLLNLDGDDTNLSCNLAHGLYSWMGAASEGGYLGADAQSFFSAVNSGAAGTYLVTLMEALEGNSVLAIKRGQLVRISGGMQSQTPWGDQYPTCNNIDQDYGLCNSGFEVWSGGQLFLTDLLLVGRMLVRGELHLSGCRIEGVGTYQQNGEVIGAVMPQPHDATMGLSDDTYGAAIKLKGSAVCVISGSAFVRNHASLNGAAIYAERTVSISVSGTTFTANFGGAPGSTTATSAVPAGGGDCVVWLKRRCGTSPCAWSGHDSNGCYTNQEASVPLDAPACTLAYPNCV
jgi:predicted outer membrane repeat protein